MKKVILAVAVIAMIGLASCNKTSTCTCTYSMEVAGVEVSTTTDPAEYEVKSCDKVDAAMLNIEGAPEDLEVKCEAAK